MLWIGSAQHGRPGPLNRFSLSFRASYDSQDWELKVAFGELRTRQPGSHGEQQTPQARRPDHGLPENTADHDFEYTECCQVTSADEPADRREMHSDGDQGRQHMSASEDWTAVNFWYSLRRDQQQAFRVVANCQLFDAGERLMREGEHGDHVAVVTSGLTEIRVREDGAERVVAQRGPGQLIGERAALKVSRRSAAVVAVVPVRALVVRTADFETFISVYPEVLDRIEEQIFTRMREHRPGAGPSDLAGQNCTVIRTDVAGFSSANRCAADRELIRI